MPYTVAVCELVCRDLPVPEQDPPSGNNNRGG